LDTVAVCVPLGVRDLDSVADGDTVAEGTPNAITWLPAVDATWTMVPAAFAVTPHSWLNAASVMKEVTAPVTTSTRRTLLL
jgi:hypothetical protein